MNNFAIQKVRTGIGPSSPSHRLCIPLCVSHVVDDESAATGRIKKKTWEYRVAQPVPPKDPALAPKKTKAPLLITRLTGRGHGRWVECLAYYDPLDASQRH